MNLPAVGMDKDQGWSKKNIRDNIVQKLKPNDIGPYPPGRWFVLYEVRTLPWCTDIH